MTDTQPPVPPKGRWTYEVSVSVQVTLDGMQGKLTRDNPKIGDEAQAYIAAGEYDYMEVQGWWLADD